jgi:shikimate kinase
VIIFVVGYMGSGKSTFGKRLANHLGYGFIDLDHLFEETYRIDIAGFFSKYGETVFRKMEHELLEKNLNHREMVVSCGGGTPCFFDNMQIMNKNGVTVYLQLTPAALAQRLAQARKKRPLLETLPGGDLEQKIMLHLAGREHFYLQAQLVVDGISVDLSKTADIIKKLINSYGV